MNLLKKALAHLTSQIKKPQVILPAIVQPHKIKDDNQSIHNGVINEQNSEPSLRSATEPSQKRKRGRPAKRET